MLESRIINKKNENPRIIYTDEESTSFAFFLDNARHLYFICDKNSEKYSFIINKYNKALFDGIYDLYHQLETLECLQDEINENTNYQNYLKEIYNEEEKIITLENAVKPNQEMKIKRFMMDADKACQYDNYYYSITFYSKDKTATIVKINTDNSQYGVLDNLLTRFYYDLAYNLTYTQLSFDDYVNCEYVKKIKY